MRNALLVTLFAKLHPRRVTIRVERTEKRRFIARWRTAKGGYY